ncbi:MAG: hypothetical protein IJ125_04340 [Atopobiaceae bacterium]|nr:hypothetical protein [Atopobiaceae bacterium]
MPTSLKRGWRSYLASLLRIIATVLRIFAALLCLVVLVLTFASGTLRDALLPLVNFFGGLMLAPISGLFVYETIFGGAFRGDFALAAFLTLIVDWLLNKLAFSLQQRDRELAQGQRGDIAQAASPYNPPTYPNGGRVAEPYDHYNRYEQTAEQKRNEALHRARHIKIDDFE